jgi:hypothetical protein
MTAKGRNSVATKKTKVQKDTIVTKDEVVVEPKKSTRLAKLQWKKVVVGAIAVLLIAGIGFFAWQYKHAHDEVARLSNPQEAAKAEVQQLTDKVSKLVVMPNETPTLATVNDPSKLKDQTFFARAEKGDKVLIFTQAKRAILYRPSTNKVIESAPVNIGDGSAQSTGSTPTAPAQ